VASWSSEVKLEFTTVVVGKLNMTRIILIGIITFLSFSIANAQTRQPSRATKPIVVKTKQQIADVMRSLERQEGNKNEDVVAASGMQMRVAVFHDEKRENDLVEVHDGSDDIYYVLEGTATLLLGGTLVEPNEISPGEWRSKTSAGGQKYEIKKGDIIVVPRGTPHQRTVTGKGFSMILIKVFEKQQP
jgi:mannose-6-phosphate isomerase-like protein (cupin superfamily)